MQSVLESAVNIAEKVTGKDIDGDGDVGMRAATLKALFAVLVSLNRPEMSEQEVCASTGASLTNFKRWRRRVLNA